MSLNLNSDLDDDHPLWLINEQIKGLLEGLGASEDHEAVVTFLRNTGLPEATVARMHQAIVHGDNKSSFHEQAVSLIHMVERECCRTFFNTPHRSTCSQWRGKKGGAA